MRIALFVLVISCLALVHLPADEVTHEVKPGDTLYGIAREYGISVRELSEINRIDSPDLLLPGTILSVGREYRVRAGDTLYGIARNHDTTVATLQELNDLESSTIVTGQRLKLPVQPRERERSDTDRVATEPTRESSTTEEDPRREVIPIALSLEEPISFAEGGVWPVAGRRTKLEGKLPGVLISAERGTSVTAVASGRVVYAGPHSTFGNVVFIQSVQGYIYVYGGQESISVDVGDTIDAGSTVGTVGTNPAEGVSALYFSVWRNDTFVDPESAPRG